MIIEVNKDKQFIITRFDYDQEINIMCTLL